ncbi:MAG: AAA family ATPase [Chitinophagales bacterium]
MNQGIKLSYSISNFKDLVKQGYYYVDKTPYIEQLENMAKKYFFFLRPRRFGKSLFISMLHHYYGLEHKDTFQELFGNYYIGKHPTPMASKYLVLRFEFTQIDTSSAESTLEGFLRKVREGISRFCTAYPQFFTTEEQKEITEKTYPAHLMSSLLILIKEKAPDHKVYILVDEYDHFANELIAFDLENFKDIVSKKGFVRKFYEAIKEGTYFGTVDRFFSTGITPITLDSMTSGFNIATNLSLDLNMTELMGFTEDTVKELFELAIPNKKEDVEELLPLMKDWYNGYKLNHRAKNRLFNPNMVLYFIAYYQAYGELPEEMLDTNIASDYHKVRRLMNVATPKENHQTLDKIIEEGELEGLITQQFSFAKIFTQHDFMSLLFYNGFLTIDYALGNIIYFRVPNYVIQKLYFDYFREVLQENKMVDVNTGLITSAIASMAFKGNPQAFFDLIHSTLHQLANRDYQKFDEKYVKIIMITYMMLTNTFFIESERETPAGYLDLSFLESPNIPIQHQYIFELKYLKKEDAKQLKAKQKEAKKQLLEYVAESAKLNKMSNLQAWTVVVVKDELNVERVR